MRIIEIEMQCFIALKKLIEFFNRGQITEHAVYTITKVPDTFIACGEFVQSPVERFHVVVPDHFHRGSKGAYMLYSHLDTVVNLLIHNHSIFFTDERGNGCQVSQGCGRRNQNRSIDDALEQILQFTIRRGRKVASRRGELCAIAHDGIDRSLLEAWVHFQAKGTAQSEIDEWATLQMDKASIERFAIRREL